MKMMAKMNGYISKDCDNTLLSHKCADSHEELLLKGSSSIQ